MMMILRSRKALSNCGRTEMVRPQLHSDGMAKKGGGCLGVSGNGVIFAGKSKICL